MACFTDNIKEFELCKKIRNRFSNQPKVKRFNIFSFFSNMGKFSVVKTHVDFSKIKVTDRVTKFKNICIKYGLHEAINLGKHIDCGLPYPVTKVSRIIGTFKHIKNKPRIPYGVLMKERDEDSLVKHVFSRAYPEYVESQNIVKMKVFPGSHIYNNQNVVDMCTPPSTEYSVKELLDGYFSRVGIDFALPKFSNYDVKSILGVEVNVNSKPGILSTHIVGPKRKKTVKYSKVVAYNYAKNIMKRDNYTLDKSLYQIGGREKRVKSKLHDVWKRVKTRTIFMQEDVPTLIGQSVMKYVMVGLQYLDKGHNYGGKINGRRNFLKFIRTMAPTHEDVVNGQGDFEGHDNTVTERKIVVAMSLIRLCFPESKEIDRIFFYVMSSAVFKRVVEPESDLVYEIEQGLPSGHALTSILTTFIAYGTFATAINNVYNEGMNEDPLRFANLITDSFIHNAGDDVMYKMYYWAISLVYSDIKNKSGMKIDDLSDSVGYVNSLNEITRRTFLKKKYGNGLFSWNDSELFDNLLYPTMKERGFGPVVDSLLQVIQSAPYDHHINCIIKILICSHKIKQIYTSGRVSNQIIIDDTNVINNCRYTREGGVEVTKEVARFIDYIFDQKTNYTIDVDNVILSYDYTYVANQYGKYGYYVDYNVKEYIRDLLKYINDIIDRKSVMMLYRQTYRKHVNMHRLRVFDIYKEYVQPVQISDSMQRDLAAML